MFNYTHQPSWQNHWYFLTRDYASCFFDAKQHKLMTLEQYLKPCLEAEKRCHAVNCESRSSGMLPPYALFR